MSVSGDAVMIEEEHGPGSDRDDDGEEDNGNPIHSDPRLAAVRWRRRAAPAVRGGAWMLVGAEQSASSPWGGENRGWGQDEVMREGEGSPLVLPLAGMGQQAFVTRNQTV